MRCRLNAQISAQSWHFVSTWVKTDRNETNDKGNRKSMGLVAVISDGACNYTLWPVGKCNILLPGKPRTTTLLKRCPTRPCGLYRHCIYNDNSNVKMYIALIFIAYTWLYSILKYWDLSWKWRQYFEWNCMCSGTFWVAILYINW